MKTTAEHSISDDTQARPLILFDGVCNLCNASVQWVIERDRHQIFDFASLQSNAARQKITQADSSVDVDLLPDSIVLVDQKAIHHRSDAALRIAKLMGFPYALLWVGVVVPRPLRDAVYNFVARNRYRWFGRTDTCSIPTPEQRTRFLDADEALELIEHP